MGRGPPLNSPHPFAVIYKTIRLSDRVDRESRLTTQWSTVQVSSAVEFSIKPLAVDASLRI